MHAATDPMSGVYQGLIVALQHSSNGSFILADDGLASGVVDSSVDGGDTGWSDREVHGVVARVWNDALFFGDESILVECVNPPTWTCTQLPNLDPDWSITGGAVSPAGHVLLVGPTTVLGNLSGNTLFVLHAGVRSELAHNWISLALSFGAGQEASAVSASETEIQVLGISRDQSNGDRLRLWSFEPP
jgi:hypothetical protein